MDPYKNNAPEFLLIGGPRVFCIYIYIGGGDDMERYPEDI